MLRAGTGGWEGDLLLIPFVPAEEITGLLLDTNWKQAQLCSDLAEGWAGSELRDGWSRRGFGDVCQNPRLDWTGLGWKGP